MIEYFDWRRRFARWLYFKLLRWYPRWPTRYIEWVGWSIPRGAGLECVGRGWAGLVGRCYDVTDRHHVVVTQVKEKFGGLRFYVGSAMPGVFDQIDEITKESYKICERCGEPGVPRKGGWILTLCDACDATRGEWRWARNAQD